MANQQKGELGVEVEGTRYTLRPDFNALCELEDLTGKTFFESGFEINAGAPNAGLRRVIWCLLQPMHAEEIRTLRQSGEWIVRAGGADVVLAWVNKLFAMIADEEKGQKKNPHRAQVNGTGRHSSPMRDASA